MASPRGNEKQPTAALKSKAHASGKTPWCSGVVGQEMARNTDYLSACYSMHCPLGHRFTPEVVDAFLCAYCLSMLSRYFRASGFLVSNRMHGATKIIERLVVILREKAPIMAAWVLENEDVVISTQQPPWYSGSLNNGASDVSLQTFETVSAHHAMSSFSISLARRKPRETLNGHVRRN